MIGGRAEMWLKSKKGTLLSCCLGTALNVTSLTVMPIALPNIVDDLRMDGTTTQWAACTYQLAVGIFMVTASVLADRFGTKKIFAGGTLIAAIGEIICGLASEPAVLLGGRIVEGVGGAVLPPVSLALVSHTFKGGERHIAMGKYSAAAGLSMLMSPIAGGGVLDFFNWRWLFFLNAVLSLVTCIIIMVGVREPPILRKISNLDLPGQILAGISMAALLGLIVGIGAQAQTSWLAIGGVATAVSSAAFAWTEKRSPNPLIQFSIFRRRGVASAAVLASLLFLSFGGLTFYTLIFLQRVVDVSALQAGFLMAPLALAMIIASRVAGRWASRGFSKNCITLGFGVMAFGLILLAITPRPAFLPAVYALIGSGLGATFGPISTRGCDAALPQDVSMVSAVIAAFRMITGAFSVAIVGTVIEMLVTKELTRALGSVPPEVLRIASGGSAADIDLPQATLCLTTQSFTNGLNVGYIVLSVFAISGMLISWRVIKK